MINVCILPARGQSVRIPRKNIRPFYGRPIISYPIATAQASGLFDGGIYVSTEDDEIASVARQYGAEVIKRPPELAEIGARDCGTQAVVRHALQTLKEAGRTDLGTVCCIYPAVPMIKPIDLQIAQAIHLLRPAKYVISVGINPLRDIGNFYMGQAATFLEGAELWGTWTAIYLIPPERAIDINTPDDWQRAETMYSYFRNAT